MKIMILLGLTVVISGCAVHINKVGGNEFGVTYSSVGADNIENLYPLATKHCASYGKKSKLINRVSLTYIFECI